MKKENIITLLSILVILTSLQVIKVSSDFVNLITNLTLKTDEFTKLQNKNIPDIKSLDILNKQIEKSSKIVENIYFSIEQSCKILPEINSNTLLINNHINNIILSNKSISSSSEILSKKLDTLNSIFYEVIKENQNFTDKLKELSEISSMITEEMTEVQTQLQKPSVINLIKKFKEAEEKK